MTFNMLSVQNTYPVITPGGAPGPGQSGYWGYISPAAAPILGVDPLGSRQLANFQESSLEAWFSFKLGETEATYLVITGEWTQNYFDRLELQAGGARYFFDSSAAGFAVDAGLSIWLWGPGPYTPTPGQSTTLVPT